MMQKKYLIFITVILAAFIIACFMYVSFLQKYASGQNNFTDYQNVTAKLPLVKSENCGASENTIVTKVIDGDTVIAEGGYHVRLLGIDADEKDYPCYDAAKKHLEDLVLSKQVRLEKDVTDVDQYQRCLRFIFSGQENINLQLVKEGLAVARFYQPDVKYKHEIQEAEKQAIENKIGCKWK